MLVPQTQDVFRALVTTLFRDEGWFAVNLALRAFSKSHRIWLNHEKIWIVAAICGILRGN